NPKKIVSLPLFAASDPAGHYLSVEEWSRFRMLALMVLHHEIQRWIICIDRQTYPSIPFGEVTAQEIKPVSSTGILTQEFIAETDDVGFVFRSWHSSTSPR